MVSEVFIDPSVFVAPGPGSSSVLAAARPSQHDFLTSTSPPILANDAPSGTPVLVYMTSSLYWGGGGIGVLLTIWGIALAGCDDVGYGLGSGGTLMM